MSSDGGSSQSGDSVDEGKWVTLRETLEVNPIGPMNVESEQGQRGARDDFRITAF